MHQQLGEQLPVLVAPGAKFGLVPPETRAVRDAIPSLRRQLANAPELLSPFRGDRADVTANDRSAFRRHVTRIQVAYQPQCATAQRITRAGLDHEQQNCDKLILV